jgi:hypothetical protein
MDSEDEEGKPVDLRIYGPGDDSPHRRIDISFSPCTHEQENPSLKSETAKLKKTYKLDKKGKPTTKFDWEIVGERCAVDLEDPEAVKARKQELFDYLGFSRLMVLSNHSSFDLAEYGEDK